MPGYPGPDRMETGGKNPRRKPGYNYPPAGNRGYIGQSSSMRAIPPDFQFSSYIARGPEPRSLDRKDTGDQTPRWNLGYS